jgi:PhnB protein
MVHFQPDSLGTVTPRIVVSNPAAQAGRDVFPAFLYVYVENADAIYQRAVAMKARSIEVPSDMPYGDRRAMVRDLWGNVWQIATHRRSV